MEYIRFSFNTKNMGLEKSQINLYPLVCMHLGSSRCDYSFLKERIRTIEKDPNGFWIYMGDAGECVTKLSKGDVYKQLLSPQGQMDAIADVMEPISDKGLFGVSGNHGRRIYRETGLDFDKNLCHRLGIPYLGTCAFANILVNRSSYDLYVHHGNDSGTSLQSKISAAEAFARFIDADAILTAHSHVAMELQPSTILSADNNARAIRTKLRHQYICGSAYDSRGDYAEEKGYPPLLPSYLTISLDGRIIEGKAQVKQTSRVVRSDGQHELKHDYVLKYRE